MDSKFYEEILEQNKDAVKAKVVEAMLASISRQFEWELPKEIQAVVSEFIKAEVLPEVKAELFKNKDELVNAATAFVRGVPEEIAKKMQEQVAKTLTNSYSLQKVVEVLLRG